MFKPNKKFYISKGSIMDLVHLATVVDDKLCDIITNLDEFKSDEMVYLIKDDDVESISIWGTIDGLSDYLSEFNDEELDNLSYVERNYISKIETHKRPTVFATLDTIWHKEHDFIEVTQWSNGEGFDITISDKQVISLHDTELDVINVLVKN
jgi:hypothetical protein